MRLRVQGIAVPPEVAEFADDIAHIFRELGPTGGGELITGECSPSVDVYETDEALEIVVDVPGVSASAARVVVKGQAVLIAGEKRPRSGRGKSSFHLVERGFGRFARAVRLSPPCDGSRARARLAAGELRITLPKIVERRGQRVTVAIEQGATTSASSRP